MRSIKGRDQHLSVDACEWAHDCMAVLQQVPADLPLLLERWVHCNSRGWTATLLGPDGDIRNFHANWSAPIGHEVTAFLRLLLNFRQNYIFYLLWPLSAFHRGALHLYCLVHVFVPSCKLFAGMGVVFAEEARTYDRGGCEHLVHHDSFGSLLATGRY